MRGAPFSARDRRLRHGVPLAIAGVLAFVVGIVVGGGGGGAGRDPPRRAAPPGGGGGRQDRAAAEKFVHAWARGDSAAAYRLLDAPSRTATPPARFAALNEAARTTATVPRVRVGEATGEQDGRVPVHLRIGTKLFGNLRATFRLPAKEGKIHWT